MAFMLKTQIIILEEPLISNFSSTFQAWKFFKIVLGKNVEKMSILSWIFLVAKSRKVHQSPQFLSL